MHLLISILQFLFIALFVTTIGLGIYLFATDKPDIIIAFSPMEEQMRNIPINAWIRLYHSQLSKLLTNFSITYFIAILFVCKTNWRTIFLGSLCTILLITEQMVGHYFPFSDIIHHAEPEQINNMPISSLYLMAKLGNLPWSHIHIIILPIILMAVILLYFRQIKIRLLESS